MTSFPLTARFAEALQFAQTWHTGQYRKHTAVPYLSHILGVASVALEFGATEDEAIAALLHDALEDGPQNTGLDAAVLQATIETTFGQTVSRLVEGATDAMPNAGEAKAPWHQRKSAYLHKLHREDASSLLVSASDKLHNARTILTEVLTAPQGERAAFFGRFGQGRDGTLQYYRLLADTYPVVPGGQPSARLRVLFAELERTVAALEAACGVTSEETRHFAPLREETTRLAVHRPNAAQR